MFTLACDVKYLTLVAIWILKENYNFLLTPLQGYRYGPAVWTNFPNISDQKQESSGNTLLLFIGRLMSIKWDSGTGKREFQKFSICRYILVCEALGRIVVYYIRHLITSFSPISVSFNAVVLFTEWVFAEYKL